MLQYMIKSLNSATLMTYVQENKQLLAYSEVSQTTSSLSDNLKVFSPMLYVLNCLLQIFIFIN